MTIFQSLLSDTDRHRHSASCAFGVGHVVMGWFFLTLPILALAQPPQRSQIVESIVGEISTKRIHTTVDALVRFGTRHTLSDSGSQTRGIGAARRWIKAQFDNYSTLSRGRLRVSYQEYTAPQSTRVSKPVKVVNVIARLIPTGDDTLSARRIIIVGAHYDSRASDVNNSSTDSPGADDDGSGIAVVLELARVFSTHEFRATILFVCFAGEEQGLLGSEHFISVARSSGWNIEAMLNNDIVGNIRGGQGGVESTYVRVFSEGLGRLDTGNILTQRQALGLENDGASRSLGRAVKEIGERYLPHFGVELIYRRDRFLRGGDQIPFQNGGFAAIRLTEAKEDFAHQHQDVRLEEGVRYGDLPDFMDFNYCTNIARINAAALATLALAPTPPTDATIITKSLSYTTGLSWQHAPEPNLAGFIIRYRKTTASSWEHSMFTSDMSITLDVSEDDHLFGIAAVDNEGNVSLIAIPRANR